MGPITPPAVRCLACGFAWNSPALAHGLKAIGSCPKCSGDLHFLVDVEEPSRAGDDRADTLEPHMALGVPRF
jgi:hypothetical protein